MPPQEAVSVSVDQVELPTETTDDLERAEKEAKEEAPKTEPDEGGVEIEVEGEEADSRPTEGRDFAKENAELKQQLLDIGMEVRTLRGQLERGAEKEEKPKKKQAEPAGDEISDDQLLAVMEEHKDNPGVLLRVYKHLAEQAATKVATGIRDETMRDVEYQSWHRELRGHNDQVMGPVYQTDPQAKALVADTANRLGLDKHPMGEVRAYSLIQYARRGQEVETKEAGKKAEASEAKRVEDIIKHKGLDKTRPAGDKGAKGKVSLSEEQKKVADKLGVSHAAYAKFVPKE